MEQKTTFSLFSVAAFRAFRVSVVNRAMPAPGCRPRRSRRAGVPLPTRPGLNYHENKLRRPL